MLIEAGIDSDLLADEDFLSERKPKINDGQGGGKSDQRKRKTSNFKISQLIGSEVGGKHDSSND
jgi:hypothetical protein